MQYGDDLVGFMKVESSYGVPVVPTATDCFRAMSIGLGPVINRIMPDDVRGTLSRPARVEGRTSATWSVNLIWRPSGTAGTRPDISDFFKLAFGTETVNGGTSVVYTLLKDRTGLWASIFAKLTDIVQFVRGAIVQRMRISWTGDGLIMIEFSGVAKAFGETGNTTANGTGTSATALTVADADFLSQYSIIQVGSDTNSGAGFLIATAPNFSTEVITLPSASSWSNGAAIAPYTPTPTHVGSPVHGMLGSLSLDGGSTTIMYLGGAIEFNTGMDLLNNEAASSSPSDAIITGRREIGGTLDFLVRKTETYLMSHFRRKVAKDVRIILGDTAGALMQHDLDVVEIDPVMRDVPDHGMVRVSLPFYAALTAAEDEYTMTLT